MLKSSTMFMNLSTFCNSVHFLLYIIWDYLLNNEYVFWLVTPFWWSFLFIIWSPSLFLIMLFFKKMFYLFLRERNKENVSGGRGRGSEASSVLTTVSLMQVWIHKLWNELSCSWTLNWLSHPGTPLIMLYIWCY